MKKKVKKAQLSDSNHTANEKPNNVSATNHEVWTDEYTDIFTLRKKPINGVFVERFAQDMVKFFADDESEGCSVRKYLIKKGMGSTEFYRLVEKFPLLEKALEFVKEMIADRLQFGALTRKYDSATVFKIWGHYDHVVRDEEERRESLRAKHDHTSEQQIRVVIERFPESAVVPPLITKSDGNEKIFELDDKSVKQSNVE